MPDRFTFCMLTPDGVLADQRDPLLEALRAGGFEVLGSRLLQMDWGRLARMYHHGDYPPPASGHPSELPEAVLTPLYRLAPACVLVLHRPTGQAAETILALKGATEPLEAAPGSMRAQGEHIIFNYLHCPDGEEDATLELATLVGPEDARGLRQGAPHAGPESLLEAWPVFQGPEALSFACVARRLRWRVVMKLGALAPSDALDQAVALLGQERLPEGPGAARLAAAREAHPPIQEALLQACQGHAGLKYGVEALGELYLPEGRRRLTPILRLRDYGVYISELERVAMDGHRHAHWSPRYSPGDYRL